MTASTGPACWSWPVLQCEHEQAFEATLAERERPGAGFAIAIGIMERWQAGRCPVCGAILSMVTDHDHETGNLRGLLCPSCNSRKGRAYRDNPLFLHYRLRPRAVILGVGVFYAEPDRPTESQRELLAQARSRWQAERDPARRR